MGGLVVEKGSSGQGWEGLRIIHIGDRHSTRLRETRNVGKLEEPVHPGVRKEFFFFISTDFLFTPTPLNSRRYLGIMRTIFEMTFLFKGG